MSNKNQPSTGLYRPDFERENCGFGLIANMDGKPSHWLVDTAIGALARLTHRGAVAADGKTGDGCGLLLKKPDSFLKTIAEEKGFKLADLYATGMIFLNTDEAKAAEARSTLETEHVGGGRLHRPCVVGEPVHDVGAQQTPEDHDLRRDHPPHREAPGGHPRGTARGGDGSRR